MKGIKSSATPMSPEWQEQRSKALEEASKPMVDFVNQYCCPHDVVIIQQGTVALYSGECAFPTEVLD
jgi:hypothetical protein